MSKELTSVPFEKAFLTVADVRSYLNISNSAAYELVHRDDFPVAYLGSIIRIPTELFLAWVEQRTQVPESLNQYLVRRQSECEVHEDVC